MKYLRVSGEYQEIGAAWSSYRAYLASIRNSIPAEVYAFATEDWHYNPKHHRCLHDSWLEEMTIREQVVDARTGRRGMDIEVRLLGAYHDGHTTLKYVNVLSYTLQAATGNGANILTGATHGDWVIDEVRLARSGAIAHEAIFSSGATWLITSDTIKYSSDIPDIVER